MQLPAEVFGVLLLVLGFDYSRVMMGHSFSYRSAALTAAKTVASYRFSAPYGGDIAAGMQQGASPSTAKTPG